MDNLENKPRLTPTAFVVAALAATTLLAQSRHGAQDQQTQEQEQRGAKPTLHIVGHDTIIGAVVTNGREGNARQTLGNVADLVLDGQSGQVRYVVLASGGTLGLGKRKTPIAFRALEWNAKVPGFTLSMTAEELRQVPEFDPKNLHVLDRDGASGGAADQRTGNRGNATTGSHDAATNGAGPDTVASYLLASNIGARAVVAGEDKIGNGDKLFIERAAGTTVFLSVASGGVIGIGATKYVVPWAALRLTKPLGEQEMQIALDKGKEAMDAAPRLDDEGADVTKPEFRAKVYEFYGVARPTFEPQTSADDDGKDTDRMRREPEPRR